MLLLTVLCFVNINSIVNKYYEPQCLSDLYPLSRSLMGSLDWGRGTDASKRSNNVRTTAFPESTERAISF